MHREYIQACFLKKQISISGVAAFLRGLEGVMMAVLLEIILSQEYILLREIVLPTGENPSIKIALLAMILSSDISLRERALSQELILLPEMTLPQDRILSAAYAVNKQMG